MTEPNEPATPLTRMRFSWQRGAPAPDGEDAVSPDAVVDEPTTDDRARAGAWTPSEGAPSQHPGPTSPMRGPTQAPVQYPGPEQYPEPATEPYADELPPPATRLGRAAQPSVPAAPDVNPAPGHDFEEPLRLDDDSRRRPSKKKIASEAVRRPVAPPRAEQEPRRAGSKGRNAAATFDVPRAGGRFTGGRGGHTAVRVTLILTTCLLVLALVGFSAYMFGFKAMRSDTYHLSDEDIARFRLTEYPAEEAGRFAADYARLCFTHSVIDESNEQRRAQLARYISDGVDESCGWTGSGSQDVIDSSWAGSSEPIDTPGYAGHARVMTVRVLTSAGSRIVTVPVYVADLRTGEGMRVIGDIGEMPQPILVNPPESAPIGEVDQELSDALVQGAFFRQFFEAWGKSDGPSLVRFTTADASAQVKAGLTGTLSSPKIDRAQVFLPASTSADGHAWAKGDRAEAWVSVTWKNPSAGSDVGELRAYRLRLTMTTDGSNPAQSWAVQDVRGGVPVVQGR